MKVLNKAHVYPIRHRVTFELKEAVIEVFGRRVKAVLLADVTQRPAWWAIKRNGKYYLLASVEDTIVESIPKVVPRQLPEITAWTLNVIPLDKLATTCYN